MPRTNTTTATRNQLAISKQVLDSLENTLTMRLPKLVRLALTQHVKAGKPQKRVLTALARPPVGGKCEVVWAAADHIVAQGGTPTLEALRKIGKAKGWNANNTRIEFYRWRAAQPKAH